jgi:hypothetical protein
VAGCYKTKHDTKPSVSMKGGNSLSSRETLALYRRLYRKNRPDSTTLSLAHVRS